MTPEQLMALSEKVGKPRSKFYVNAYIEGWNDGVKAAWDLRESELSRLKKEAEWKTEMLERAKSYVGACDTAKSNSWIADLERGPGGEKV